MSMIDWIARLDDFLKLSDREILTHAGTISHDAAREKAEAEFVRFKAQQAALPQPVDEHFAQSLDALKQIESRAREAKKKVAGKPAPQKKAAKKSKGKKRSDD